MFISTDVWTERLTLTAITTFLPSAKTELAEVRCQVTGPSLWPEAIQPVSHAPWLLDTPPGHGYPLGREEALPDRR